MIHTGGLNWVKVRQAKLCLEVAIMIRNPVETGLKEQSCRGLCYIIQNDYDSELHPNLDQTPLDL